MIKSLLRVRVSDGEMLAEAADMGEMTHDYYYYIFIANVCRG